MKEPSWAEIRHFVKFLDLQLESCEGSVFTKPEIIGDIMTGLKGFIFKFMIHMSRVRSSSNQEAFTNPHLQEYQPKNPLYIPVTIFSRCDVSRTSLPPH